MKRPRRSSKSKSSEYSLSIGSWDGRSRSDVGWNIGMGRVQHRRRRCRVREKRLCISLVVREEASEMKCQEIVGGGTLVRQWKAWVDGEYRGDGGRELVATQLAS